MKIRIRVNSRSNLCANSLLFSQENILTTLKQTIALSGQTNIERRTWAAFLLMALAWGTSFLFIKIAVQTVPPVMVVSSRLLFGLMGLAAVLLAQRLRLPRDLRTWRHLAVVGIVNVAIPFFLITWAESGEQGLDSGAASVLNSTVPLFSIVLSGFLLRAERVTRGMILGLLIGFVGVMILFSRPAGGEAERSSLLPYLAITVAAAFYAMGTAYARRHLRGIHPVVLATGQLSTAVVAALAFALLLGELNSQTISAAFSWPALGALLWLGLMGSCLAYILYFNVLAQWGATRTTLVTYVVPIIGVTAGVLFLNEVVDWRLLGGGALIISGVVAVNWRAK
jgi:drug/metabolite transporter (DMT)-like permease